MTSPLEVVYQDLVSAINEASLLGAEPWVDILSRFQEALEAQRSSLAVNVRRLNPIDRQGYGPNVLALQDGGMAIREISQYLSLRAGAAISPDDVTCWLAEYNEMSPGERAGRLNTDVGATRQQLQLQLERLNEQMVNIEAKAESAFRRNSKDEVILSYLQEVRMTIKTAHDMQKAEETERSNKLFQQIALQVIEKECPTAAYEIYKQLKARRVLLGIDSGGSS